MSIGILGKKLGMSQLFDDKGNSVPVTLIEAGPCRITQLKTTALDGYTAVQIGYGLSKDKHISKPETGHLLKSGEELLKHLKEYRDDCKSILKQFDHPIALHIRRGDFLINSLNHYNLSMRYYKNALDCFDEDRQVIIFSDDPDWCYKQKLFASDRFIIPKSDSPYHDLYLMTQCEDFIIANSTFSWWGAWLCKYPFKEVIYPHKWFGPNNANKSTIDLFPKSWRIINEE